MDRFVKAVNNMSATVLVPSKLRDMDIPGRKMSRIPPALAHTDLYSFYVVLNEVKKELLWGPGCGAAAAATTALPLQSARLLAACSTPKPHHQPLRPLVAVPCASSAGLVASSCPQHVRQPSDESLGSMGSTAGSSSSDPDTDDSEVDSLLTDRDSCAPGDEHTSHLAAAFRHHLQGLHTILHQLADSADYLCARYQEEIDATSSSP